MSSNPDLSRAITAWVSNDPSITDRIDAALTITERVAGLHRDLGMLSTSDLMGYNQVLSYLENQDLRTKESELQVFHPQFRAAVWLTQEYGNELMHVAGLGWHYWGDTRWCLDPEGKTARRYLTDMLQIKRGESTSSQVHKTIEKCTSATGLEGVLRLASVLDPHNVPLEHLDAKPYLLNCANGTLDLRTLTLKQHDPFDRITKVTGASYDPAATSALWSKFLDRVLPDKEVQQFLQRFVGTALQGASKLEMLLILTGVGRNGKSKFYEAVNTCLGDYSTTPSSDMLLRHSHSQHPTALMDLRGTRWAVTSENEKNRELNVSLVKSLTGNDRIKARLMRQDFVEFQPSHSLVLVTNHLPRVPADDPALWSRMSVIPFDVVIPPDERDIRLGEKLAYKGNLDAILNWAVEGLRQFRDLGENLQPPSTVQLATSSYQQTSDLWLQFFEDNCVESQTFTVPSEELFDAWRTWCRAAGHEPGTLNAFGTMLSGRGYAKKRVLINGKLTMVRQGLDLVSRREVEDESTTDMLKEDE